MWDERTSCSHAVATRFLQCIGVLLGQRGCRKSCISVLRPTNNLAMHVEPDANFDNQRRLIAYAPILQPVCVVRDPHGPFFSPAPTGPCGLFSRRGWSSRSVLRNGPLIAGWDDEKESAD